MNPETLANPYQPHFDTLPFPAQLAVGRYLEAMKQHYPDLQVEPLWDPAMKARCMCTFRSRSMTRRISTSMRPWQRLVPKRWRYWYCDRTDASVLRVSLCLLLVNCRRSYITAPLPTSQTRSATIWTPVPWRAITHRVIFRQTCRHRWAGSSQYWRVSPRCSRRRSNSPTQSSPSLWTSCATVCSAAHPAQALENACAKARAERQPDARLRVRVGDQRDIAGQRGLWDVSPKRSRP